MSKKKKKSILSIFRNARYQNTKMHAQLLICGREKTLKETCLFSVFVHVRHQNTKKQMRAPYMREKKVQNTYLLSVFQLRTITIKRMKNSLYGETE